MIGLFDTVGGALGSALMGNLDMVDLISFLYEGEQSDSTAGDTSIRLWDPRTGTSAGPGTLSNLGDIVDAILFSSDAK